MINQPVTDTDPLDVAVQVDEIERFKYALTLAVRHGYADNPDAFASRLRGSTTTELEADATEFAAEIAEIRSRQDPPRVMAVDPSQGLGLGMIPDSPAKTLGNMMSNQLIGMEIH